MITPNEVRQIMASGAIDGTAQADDVNFAQQPEPSCTQALAADLHGPEPERAVRQRRRLRPWLPRSATRRAQGHDQIFGYGRVNMNRAVDALVRTGDAAVPPEVEITAPDWYDQIDPAQRDIRRCAGRCSPAAPATAASVRGARLAAEQRPRHRLPPGDFKRVTSSWCNGDVHTSAFDGVLADVDVQELKARFPASAGDFDGREPGTGAQTSNGRPNTEPYGFTVKVVAQLDQGGVDLQGEDRRNMYLHRDQDMLPGFPSDIGGRTATASRHRSWSTWTATTATSWWWVAATGSSTPTARTAPSCPGWPVRGDTPPLHTGGRAFQSARCRTTSAARSSRRSRPRTWTVTGPRRSSPPTWRARSTRGTTRQPLWTRESNIDYSGKPLQPFEDVRHALDPTKQRPQHGFVGSPVLVDLDSNDGGRLEIVAASMDRHVYAWNDDGSPVPGFPVLVVDQTKVASVDPRRMRSHSTRTPGRR